MKSLLALVCGLLFGVGLIVSGMADPAKVQAFLDLAGAWDPSLALVMGGAIAVAMPLFAWARRRELALLGDAVQWPTRRDIDTRLVGGSVLFGVGWGLAGYCPGPAIVALGMGQGRAAVLVGTMLLGMALFEWIESRLPRLEPA
jgi:uncharacterized protein